MFCIVLYCFLLYCVSVTVYCYYLYCVLLYCVIVTGLRSGVWTVKKLTSCDMRPLGLRIVRPPPRPGGAGGSSAGSEPVCDIHFTFWISLSLRPKTETKRLNFDFRPVLRSTNHRSASSLTSSATHRWFAHRNLISNWLTYLVHAKSTSELISFGFSDRSVRSLVSAKRSANRWVQTKKNDFTFWLIFGLSPNLWLSESLSERLI